METFKQDGDYAIVKNGELYEVYCKDEPLKTPGGILANTPYLPLAERLLKDWKTLGYNSYFDPDSILSYHFSMVENFATKEYEEVLDMLHATNWEYDWTLGGCPSPNPHVWMQWESYFVKGEEGRKYIREWLSNQTVMQLVASTCIFNVFMSYNVASVLASIVENVPKSKHRSALKEFYDFYSLFDDLFSFSEVWKFFDCFRLYYGIHFKEKGKHLPLSTKDE